MLQMLSLRRPRAFVVMAPVVTTLVVGSTFFAPAAQSVALAATATAPCGDLTSVSLPNTTINSAVRCAELARFRLRFQASRQRPVVATCRVHATVTTPGAGDHIGVDVWMPVSGWNGRFQGVGGSGFVANDFNEMAAAVDAGTPRPVPTPAIRPSRQLPRLTVRSRSTQRPSQ